MSVLRSGKLEANTSAACQGELHASGSNDGKTAKRDHCVITLNREETLPGRKGSVGQLDEQVDARKDSGLISKDMSLYLL